MKNYKMPQRLKVTKKALSVISRSIGLCETWCLGVFVAKLIKLTFHNGFNIQCSTKGMISFPLSDLITFLSPDFMAFELF
jgi:hypothetical protein